jgi:hypothetical protein
MHIIKSELADFLRSPGPLPKSTDTFSSRKKKQFVSLTSTALAGWAKEEGVWWTKKWRGRQPA